MEDQHVPGLVRECRRDPCLGVFDPDSVRTDFAVRVSGGIPLGIAPVPLQVATSDHQVADDHDMPVRGGDLMQIMLDGIFGETVADGEDPERVRAGIPGRSALRQQTK